MIKYNDLVDLSILEKMKNLGIPDFYIANDVRDFIQDRDEITVSWYKNLPFFDNNMSRAYVMFSNIGIEKLDDQGIFKIHDATGQIAAFWKETKEDLYSPTQTFNEMQNQQALLDDDWVANILGLYFLKEDFIRIIEVHKYNRKQKSRKSLLDKLYPSFVPNLKPSFQ